MAPNTSPILVTGAPRSGTTFLGRMLSLPAEVAYIDEPLNRQTGLIGIERSFLYCDAALPETLQPVDRLMRDLLNGRAKFKTSSLAPPNDPAYKNLGRRLFNSRTQLSYNVSIRNPFVKRYLVKDPMACFAAEYLHRELGLQTIVIIRHPAATVASYNRLGWPFSLTDLTSQPALKRRFVDGILKGVNVERLTPFQHLAYMWLIIYTALADYAQRNPTIVQVKHEDLSMQPVAEFRRLYHELELPFTPAVERHIISHTRSGNPVAPPGNAVHVLKRDSARNVNRWKELLTADEIGEIRRITSPLSDRYYSAASW